MRPKDKKDKDEKLNDDDLFPEVRNGIFIPCNKKQKVILYIRFTYRNIEKIMLYDPKR